MNYFTGQPTFTIDLISCFVIVLLILRSPILCITVNQVFVLCYWQLVRYFFLFSDQRFLTWNIGCFSLRRSCLTSWVCSYFSILCSYSADFLFLYWCNRHLCLFIPQLITRWSWKYNLKHMKLSDDRFSSHSTGNSLSVNHILHFLNYNSNYNVLNSLDGV